MMITIFKNRKLRRRVIAIAIALLGFGSALVIFLTAPPEEPPEWDPMQSKMYLRQLEIIGGKSAVFGAELQQWFSSLWHGEQLGFTVAFLTLLVLCVYLFASAPRPRQAGTVPGVRREKAP
ncbi:MAG TPA: hypothetical protein VNN08_11495 [Thermoanaerobaculia bacterium]|nr:hypothetical protein [Thermoanaerobaculia bacterium]